jgi:P4 family phage/plasmid primase-like protien
LRQILEANLQTGEPLRPGDNRIKVIQEFMGYTLLPDSRYQKFLIMVGPGSNGKGVLQLLWIRMLGESNVAHVGLDQLGNRFSLWPLVGKMANVCGDLNEIDRVSEGILKRLTGGDPLTVDRKNQSLLTLAPTIKLVFATNTLPKFQDKSRGVWRRLMVAPFDVTIPDDKVNEQLVEELSAELPGILNFALAGLRRLLQNRGFTRCAVCNSARDEHQLDCDPFSQYVDECVQLPKSDKDQVRRISTDEQYRDYAEWCRRNGRRYAMSSGEFNRRFARLPGVRKQRSPTADPDGRRPYFWTGVGRPLPIPPPSEDDEEE